MANIQPDLKDWSTTEASNQPDSTDPTTIAGDFRAILAGIRHYFSQDTIASAGTTDLGSKRAGTLTISGTTTITSLGTVSAGIRKKVVFSGALTLTHNATSLILPTAANITTAANDRAEFESLGNGNWRCNFYQRASGAALVGVQDGEVTYAKLANTVISGATAETAPAIDDLLLLSDTSEGALNGITLANLLKVINGLTEDTGPDKAADFVATYDASAGAAKKVTPENLAKAALNATGSAPLYPIRAFVNFNGSGTVAIRAAGNVGSITDNGTGDYTANISTALPDADYSVGGFAMAVGGAGASYSLGPGASGATSQTTTAYRFGVRSISDALADIAQIYIHFIR